MTVISTVMLLFLILVWYQESQNTAAHKAEFQDLMDSAMREFDAEDVAYMQLAQQRLGSTQALSALRHQVRTSAVSGSGAPVVQTATNGASFKDLGAWFETLWQESQGSSEPLWQLLHSLRQKGYRNFKNINSRCVQIVGHNETDATDVIECVKHLRMAQPEAGKWLPVEVWLCSDEHRHVWPTAPMFTDQVTLYCWKDKLHTNDVRTARALALLVTPYHHVLVIQPQNCALMDPCNLFDLEAYQTSGALFWPDLLHVDEGIEYEYAGVRVRGYALAQANELAATGAVGAIQQETNQLVMDTLRHVKPLEICAALNCKPEVTYQTLAGDKDVFHLAWRCTASSYHWSKHGPVLAGHLDERGTFVGRCYMQHHPESGEPLFVHTVECTESVTGSNRARQLKQQWQYVNQPLTHVQRLQGRHTQLVKRLDPIKGWSDARGRVSRRGWFLDGQRVEAL